MISIDKLLILSTLTAVLTACSGFGVPQQDDPLAKLNQAESLFLEQDRPLMAEMLILEAMSIYKTQNNLHGLGNANREYADLLRSASVSGKWAGHYQSKGFQDKSVTFGNRIEKSNEYYERAISYYAKAAQTFRQEQRFDALTNVYFNTAWSYSQTGDRLSACNYYDQTLASHTDQVRNRSNSKAKPDQQVPRLVTQKKQENGCL